MRTIHIFVSIPVSMLLASTVQAEMTWLPATFASPPQPQLLNSVTWGNGQFVAVGYPAGSLLDPPGMYISPDGLSWTERPIGPEYAYLLDVVWNGSQYLAVGGGGMSTSHAMAMTSSDGITWTRHYPSGFNMYTVAWNSTATPGYYVATGSRFSPTSIRGWFSLDGQLWLTAPANVTDPARDMLWTGSQFVAVGENGLIMTSPDGIASWTRQNSGATELLSGIAYGNGLYVAVGANAPSYTSGVILTSPDTVTWTRRNYGPSPTYLNDVEWNGSIFVATGVGSNCALSSSDGINWHAQPSLYPPGCGFGAVTWNGMRWVAVEGGSRLVYSNDTTPVELLSFTVE